MTSRFNNLIRKLHEQNIDAALITDPFNLRWLTGFTGSNGLALVVSDGGAYFFTDHRYGEQVLLEVTGNWSHQVGSNLNLLDEACKCISAQPAVTSLAVDEEHLSAKAFCFMQEQLALQKVQLNFASEIFTAFRRIKEPAELDLIGRATQIADQAFQQVISTGIIGKTEREVALELEFAMRHLGADGVAFPIIVASAAHGALPHAQPRDIPICANTLVVIDWGAKLDGYCSDCTRTVATGEVQGEMRSVYELVLQAQENAVAAVRAGVTCDALDHKARSVITAAGYGDYFQHSLGHGLGLEVHEAPRLRAKNTAALATSEAITIEPGIYLSQQFGVRIEDLVVVREDKAEVLTKIPKNLAVVK